MMEEIYHFFRYNIASPFSSIFVEFIVKNCPHFYYNFLIHALVSEINMNR